MGDEPGPTTSATAPKPDAGHGGLPPWLGFALLGVSALVIAGQVWVSAERALTPLETGLFNALIFVFGLVGSVVVSAHYSRKQNSRDLEHARAEYRQLARPALRRVVAIASSTTRVTDEIGQRVERLRDTEEQTVSTAVTTEWVAGLQGQMDLLGDHLRAAIADWRELLPEEFEKAEESARQDAEAQRARVAALEGQLREKDARLEQLAGETSPQAQAEIDRLKREHEVLLQRLAKAQERSTAEKYNIGTAGNHYEAARRATGDDGLTAALRGQLGLPAGLSFKPSDMDRLVLRDETGAIRIETDEERRRRQRKERDEAAKRRKAAPSDPPAEAHEGRSEPPGQ